MRKKTIMNKNDKMLKQIVYNAILSGEPIPKEYKNKIDKIHMENHVFENCVIKDLSIQSGIPVSELQMVKKSTFKNCIFLFKSGLDLQIAMINMSVNQNECIDCESKKWD